MPKIRPLPDAHGVGFTSMEQLPQYAAFYREQQVGRHWNYHVTPTAYLWPEKPVASPLLKIDAFSPNLNKKLHVGHLRQLALAASLKHFVKAEFVALLGADGILKSSVDDLQAWFHFLQYNPTLYYDALMPKDADIVVRHKEMMPEHGNKNVPSCKIPPEGWACTRQAGHDGPCAAYPLIETDLEGNPWPVSMTECEVWDGPKGPVIVVRSNGRPTYAFHDLAFAKTVAPTHYITGVEQKEHFESLGLGDKHLPMGLVLGSDGKKLKSRTGDALTADEAVEMTMKALQTAQEAAEKSKGLSDPADLKKLAWNVLAWNFLHCARPTNIKFDVAKWTDPNVGGLYITYTYARMKLVVDKAKLEAPPEWNQQTELSEEDAKIIGYAAYQDYYLQEAKDRLDPAPLANFALDLARRLNNAYHKDDIVGGRAGLVKALSVATSVLGGTMKKCGMFTLEKV